MLILSFFSPRFLILSIFTIVPNLIVTVGGAEKVGFTTHYHSMYTPFLIFSAIMGLIEINKMKNIKIKHFSFFILIFLIFATSLIHRSSLKLVSSIPIVNIKNVLPNSTQVQAYKNNKEFYKKLVFGLPKNLRISSLEWTMPILVDYGIKRIDYFPLGLGINELLLIEYVGNSTLPSIESYLSDNEEKIKISQYIQKLIDKEYIVHKIYNYGGKKYIVYKKVGIKI